MTITRRISKGSQLHAAQSKHPSHSPVGCPVQGLSVTSSGQSLSFLLKCHALSSIHRKTARLLPLLSLAGVHSPFTLTGSTLHTFWVRFALSGKTCKRHQMESAWAPPSFSFWCTKKRWTSPVANTQDEEICSSLLPFFYQEHKPHLRWPLVMTMGSAQPLQHQ